MTPVAPANKRPVLLHWPSDWLPDGRNVVCMPTLLKRLEFAMGEIARARTEHDLVHFDVDDEGDRDALLAVHHAFLVANEELVADEIREVWSSDPGTAFFNTNGFNYFGLDDWLALWDFYRPRFRRTAQYHGGRVWIWARGGLGVIAAENVARYKEWVGEDEIAHNPPYYRSTQVCMKDDDDRWRVVHAHFSPQSEGLRPEQSLD